MGYSSKDWIALKFNEDYESMHVIIRMDGGCGLKKSIKGLSNVSTVEICHVNLEYKTFNFTDILLLRYLMDTADAEQTVNDFNSINEESMLNWSFASQIKKFIKRFVSDPYKDEEREWMNRFIEKYNIRLKTKFLELSQLIE